jgi:hypothetical protein
MAPDVGSEAPLNLSDACGADEVDHVEAERAAHEMEVCVDEPRSDEAAFEVDDLRAIACKSADFGVVSHRHDPGTARCQRLCAWAAIRTGPDVSIEIDPVSHVRGRRADIQQTSDQDQGNASHPSASLV